MSGHVRTHVWPDGLVQDVEVTIRFTDGRLEVFRSQVAEVTYADPDKFHYGSPARGLQINLPPDVDRYYRRPVIGIEKQ